MFSFKQLSLLTLVATVAVSLGGCGGDGRNAVDNPTSGVGFDEGSGGGGGGSGLPPLPQAGLAVAIDSSDYGDVESAKAVVDSNGNVTVVWTQSDGSHVDLWSSRYNVGTGWSSTAKLEGGILDVKGFQMVVDKYGDVTVVWTQDASDYYMTGPVRTDVKRTDLWAVRYTASGPGQGWGSEERIETLDLLATQTETIEDIGEFKVLVDGDGIVSVLWLQHNGSHEDLYARRNVAGVWGAGPALVDSDVGDVVSPQLLLDKSGNLFAFWTQDDGSGNVNLWGTRYAGGWSAAVKLDTEDSGPVETPVAVVDGDGAATVVWRQFDGAEWNLWSTRYSGGWEVAALAEAGTGDVSVPQLLVYGNTGVMLLWIQTDGTYSNIWSRHYAGGWVDDGNITNDTGNAGSVVMVADGAGAVTAVWVQHLESLSPVDNLWANRFAGGSWGSATLIESQDSGDVRSPMLMADSRGTDEITAIWLQAENGRFDLWSSRYSTSGGWQNSVRLETLDGGSAVDPHAVMNSDGEVTVVWRQPYDSSNLLVTSKYTIGAASGWGIVADIGDPEHDDAFSPQLVVDGSGVVTVIWLQPVTLAGETHVDLYANRF